MKPIFRIAFWMVLMGLNSLHASEPIIIDLWNTEMSGPAPKLSGAEGDRTTKDDSLIAGRSVLRLENVSKPQVYVYLPNKEKANGTAMVICPGGGFSILAWDLEGTEVAEWLNELGFAAIVLKYRVPTRHHGSPDKWKGPVMDAQRALSVVRKNSSDWNLNPNKIGILGFSAGGETAAITALKSGSRLYEAIDDIDQTTCEANFAVLIYPGGLAEKDGQLKAHLQVTKSSPPMFFVHAANDRVSCLNSIALFTALKKTGVSSELHVYSTGGHGYGLRTTETPVSRWTNRAEDWFREQQLLDHSNRITQELRNTGNPANHLPAHIRRLTWLGERPDWRHDSKRFVFLSKVFGEVYEYDLATGRTWSLTDHFTHHGFTRAQYLNNGDLLLVGPAKTFNRTDRKSRKQARHDWGQLFVLQKPFNQPPLSLNVEVDEGPAVSRKSLNIAWTHGAQAEISTAELNYEDGMPKLINIRKILTTSDFDSNPTIIETQNFVPPDEKQLTISAYRLGESNNTDAYLFDLESNKLTNLTDSLKHYDEPEGIFPDGKFTLVEHALSTEFAWPLVDLYKLSLDGSKQLDRLTFFNQWKDWKASQGVISDNGRWMLFQIGKSGDEAGRGYGIFLYDFEKASMNHGK